MKYDNYIFDLDGTLLATLDDLAASCNYALRVHGMPERTKGEVCSFVGNGVRLLMQRAVPSGTGRERADAVLATFRQHYAHHNLDTTRPYEGIMSMLATMKAGGKGLAVVSNKFSQATEDLVRHFFGEYIDVAIGENEAAGIRKKPAPDTVQEAMRRLGATVANTVYVGDSDVDIITANNCEIPCISVLWGFRSREFLLEHGATTFAETPEQLLTI